jgi:hypothetical protein
VAAVPRGRAAAVFIRGVCVDPVIEEMSRWRVDQPLRGEVARRWVSYLREIVQPQLDELNALKAPIPDRKAPKKESAA